jgi:hypothetical protein
MYGACSSTATATGAPMESGPCSAQLSSACPGALAGRCPDCPHAHPCLPAARRYEGEFEDNNMSGYGVYVWGQEGSVYRGQVRHASKGGACCEPVAAHLWAHTPL